MKKYQCVCCGYYTLKSKPPGTYEICPVCFWEDDPYQFEEPDCDGGANYVSLNQARENYKTIGASSKHYIKNVRPPYEDEM